jgi:lipid-binding SYLF domain-containing protein
MKKLLMLSLVALFAAASARAEKSRPILVDRVESCRAILEDLQGKPETAIPASVLSRAQAIVILNQFKAGFLFGVKDGYGVVMAKNDGRWSIPVLITAGEASFGLQVGADSVESVYIITDPQVTRQLYKTHFNLGVDAKAVAGPRQAVKERYNREILLSPIIAYTKSIGLFAGATVKGGHISRDDESNFALYRTRYTMPELLFGGWVDPRTAAPEVIPLMNMMQRLAP